jgi:hypothetical protein
LDQGDFRDYQAKEDEDCLLKSGNASKSVEELAKSLTIHPTGVRGQGSQKDLFVPSQASILSVGK